MMQVLLIIAAVFFILLQPVAQAQKAGDDQKEIILLNDSASALEDSDPVLSKQLTEFAKEREKEWEARNADKNSSASPVSPMKLQDEIKLVAAARVAVAPVYPLIADGLDKMSYELQGITAGMDENDFLKIYPFDQVRNFGHEALDDWFTYNKPLDDPFDQVITFHFQNNKLLGWKLDDRPEVVKEYLGEFSFYQPPSLTYEAIRAVLERMPYKDFLSVTRRQRPMLFTEFYVDGTARFASSSEFIVNKDTPPCCTEGFTIVKLGMSLLLAKTPEPIEGVVAHEIAHRVLDSIKNGNTNCNAERRANRLIVQWGFKKEFKEASELFGQKKGDPAGCQETPDKTPQKV